jgi:citrate lyase subunit beta/citryl-CoA lyase
MPGTNLRAQEKGRELPADTLIFDLEDSVAPDAKSDARQTVCAAISQGGYGDRELVVRANGLDTPWGEDDLRAAASSGADAVLLPKVSDPDEILAAVAIVEDAGGNPGIWTMMETARGILAAPEIADAHPRLAVMCMGLEDLAKELRADNSGDRTAMLYVLERAVLAARAAGRSILDAVYRDIPDDAGFVAACAQGRALGFDGKQCIHPRQISPANAAFAPAPEQVTEAGRIIEAFERANAKGEGVALLDGQLIEALHVAEARRIVAYADAIAARDKVGGKSL